jgi:hypothetical protein
VLIVWSVLLRVFTAGVIAIGVRAATVLPVAVVCGLWGTSHTMLHSHILTRE